MSINVPRLPDVTRRKADLRTARIPRRRTSAEGVAAFPFSSTKFSTATHAGRGDAGAACADGTVRCASYIHLTPAHPHERSGESRGRARPSGRSDAGQPLLTAPVGPREQSDRAKIRPGPSQTREARHGSRADLYHLTD